MKTLYFDLGMGAAGDMLTAALFELMPDRAQALAQLNALGLPGVEFIPEKASKCGVTGTHMRVVVNGREERAEDAHAHHHEHEHHEHPGGY